MDKSFYEEFHTFLSGKDARRQKNVSQSTFNASRKSLQSPKHDTDAASEDSETPTVTPDELDPAPYKIHISSPSTPSKSSILKSPAASERHASPVAPKISVSLPPKSDTKLMSSPRTSPLLATVSSPSPVDEFSTDSFTKELLLIKKKWQDKENALYEKEVQLRRLERDLERENERIRLEKDRVGKMVQRLEESERQRLRLVEELQQKEKELNERESEVERKHTTLLNEKAIFDVKRAQIEKALREEENTLRIDQEKVEFEKERIETERESMNANQAHLEQTFRELRHAEAECKVSFQSLKEEQAFITRKMNELQAREDSLVERERECKRQEAIYKENLEQSMEIGDIKRGSKRLEQEKQLLRQKEEALQEKETRVMEQNRNLQNEIRRLELLQREIIREKEKLREERSRVAHHTSSSRSSRPPRHAPSAEPEHHADNRHLFSPELNIDEDLNRSERIRSWIRSLEKDVSRGDRY